MIEVSRIFYLSCGRNIASTCSIPPVEPNKKAGSFFQRPLTTLIRCEKGTAAIEFALVMPVLLLFMMGVICYGGYFWLAHDVQQLANNAARAAIAGLDATERTSLAKSTVDRDLGQSDALESPRAIVSVREFADAVTVTVSYDASNSAFWVLLDMLPLPSQTIRRSATVSLGGY